ncbi:hypothetical protein CPB83DRAFT_840686 [Crepidotus variabilis]|uniref:Uncharacterized protein n=1 Tax=Crepidotus variabilis TaxID=179855 RepID=A0A9P6JIL7_9AGAR|nr:hypothetical protein CPB83DRAFT_840686 [Crepidotus variabilis]
MISLWVNRIIFEADGNLTLRFPYLALMDTPTLEPSSIEPDFNSILARITNILFCQKSASGITEPVQQRSTLRPAITYARLKRAMATNNLSNESYKSLELMADTIRALMDEVNALRVEVNELKSLIPVQTITQSDRPLTTNDVPANRNLAVPSGVFRNESLGHLILDYWDPLPNLDCRLSTNTPGRVQVNPALSIGFSREDEVINNSALFWHTQMFKEGIKLLDSRRVILGYFQAFTRVIGL